MALNDLFRPFLDAIIPPRPAERLVRVLTLEQLRALSGPRTESFEALLPYHDPRCLALVWELKYRRSSRALELGAALFEEPLLSIAGEELAIPLLIPVPMHEKRRQERGFNQTELLGRAIALRMPNSVEYAEALARVREAPPQQGLPRKERLLNQKGSIAAKEPMLIAGRVCVIVDDVATTGATFEEARRALNEAGARSVHCIALAS